MVPGNICSGRVSEWCLSTVENSNVQLLLAREYEICSGGFALDQTGYWDSWDSQKRIVFSVIGGKKIALLTEEILYFERMKRVTRIVSVFGNYEIRDKLDSIAEKLPEREFLRCHNSYIVNRLAICEKQKNYFVMRNGDNVTISRSYIKSIREFLNE